MWGRKERGQKIAIFLWRHLWRATFVLTYTDTFSGTESGNWHCINSVQNRMRTDQNINVRSFFFQNALVTFSGKLNITSIHCYTIKHFYTFFNPQMDGSKPVWVCTALSLLFYINQCWLLVQACQSISFFYYQVI